MLFMVASVLWPQQPTPKPQTPPPFRLRTDIVHSQVIVRNERGDFIPGLTEKDFEIYEDGVRQTILTFTATLGGRVMTETAPAKPPVREGMVMPANARAAEIPGRIFIIFIDDLHLQPQDTPMVQRVLRLIRDTLVHEQDMVGLVSSGYSSIATEVGLDPQHRRFDQAIEKVI